MALNKLVLHGRLVRDPNCLVVQDSLDVANFTVAWDNGPKGKEEKLFLDCVAYGSNAKTISNHFKKGNALIVVGKLVTNKYTTKNGENRYSTKLKVSEVHFVTSKAEREQEREMNQYNNATDDYDSIDDSVVPSDIDDDDEDLPF